LTDLVSTFAKLSAEKGAERLYAKGEQLFSRGDAPKFMFWIKSGEARLSRTSLMGSEIIFQRAQRGFLAEASYDQSVYHCDGVAVQNTRALVLPVDQFRAALATTELRDMWLKHLSQELRRVRAHSERLSLRTANDRIIHFIETEGSDGQIVLSQSKKSWASELGLTHEALYRSLRTMTDDGILKISGHVVRLGVLHKS
jgi:CRP/FNR family transcriptional regulator, dissimilatory nitrate respiration regulator